MFFNRLFRYITSPIGLKFVLKFLGVGPMGDPMKMQCTADKTLKSRGLTANPVIN